jgi:hypothetical protein
MLFRMNFRKFVAPVPACSMGRLGFGNFGRACVVAGAILVGAACSTIRPLSTSHADQAPPHAITVSACSDNGVNVRRITSDGGVQFEVPDNTFIASKASRDMPPGTMNVVKLKNDDASLVIWHDDDFSRDLKIAYPVFSSKTGKSDIVTAGSGKFGTDRWGYLDGRTVAVRRLFIRGCCGLQTDLGRTRRSAGSGSRLGLHFARPEHPNSIVRPDLGAQRA